MHGTRIYRASPLGYFRENAPMSRFIRATEAERVLNCSRRTLTRLVKAGKLRGWVFNSTHRSRGYMRAFMLDARDVERMAAK